MITMKTTIEIPDELYKKAKIHAIDSGMTLKQIVITSLKNELEKQISRSETTPTFAQRRKLIPSYQAALDAGAYAGGTDSSLIVSEDRSSREDALL